MANYTGILPMDIESDSEDDFPSYKQPNFGDDDIVMQAQTEDGKIFDLNKSFLFHNKTLMNLFMDITGVDIKNGEEYGEILQTPLGAVEGDVMEFVVSYTKTHKSDVIPKYDNEHYDATQLSGMDNGLFTSIFSESKERFFKVIKAANYLDNQLLLDNACKYVASLLRGKTPQEIRTLFNIENNISNEKESQITQINQWVNDI